MKALLGRLWRSKWNSRKLFLVLFSVYVVPYLKQHGLTDEQIEWVLRAIITGIGGFSAVDIVTSWKKNGEAS